MGFDSKRDFARLTILLGLLLCPWMWGISSQSLQPCTSATPAPRGFTKVRGTRGQIANIYWIIKKAREFQKNIYFCFIDYAKAFALCGSQ